MVAMQRFSLTFSLKAVQYQIWEIWYRERS